MVLILLAILSSCCVVSEANETVSELAPSGIQKCRDVVPECECNDSKTILELHCWNVSDFEKFNEKLNKRNTLYTIYLHKDSFLPRGFLRGLNVFGLVVDDPHFQGLDEKAFEGVVELEHFFVLNSSATSADIPEGAQPARPARAPGHLLLQQLHRVRRARRIPGYRGSDALQHLSQPADVPPTRLVQIMDEASYGGALSQPTAACRPALLQNKP
ncbi:hypothetical protein CEXT_251311 [Caerostris extrusa]|uniref:Uncharacterized protein n=1 Tax=Caerostris extrusa TaxID=172846 RepID=A0AAV4QHQ8_CAEEX|nr:hypothetical protein CEXT_251311 [Caerostris extrusa]